MNTVVKSLQPVEKTEAGAVPDLPPSAAVDDRLRAEVAGYIAQMTAEMAGMARSTRLDLLAYFLDMARIEANSQRQSRI